MFRYTTTLYLARESYSGVIVKYYAACAFNYHITHKQQSYRLWVYLSYDKLFSPPLSVQCHLLRGLRLSFELYIHLDD